LLGNVYAHHVLDLWAHQWRTRNAHGDVVIVRFADLCGSPHRSAYAESRVMPSGCRDRPWLLGLAAESSA
jgi:hypothetical protein